MKEMSLKDIQGVSLDIMKRLHTFCVEHGIKYSLGYGTLLGAIRHKGFIPWDDDIDVFMMREDFDRFCEIYEDTVDYKLFSYNRGNTYSAVARLCDMQRTMVKTGSPLFTEQTGVWIDVFPLDSVDNEKSVFEQRIIKIKEAHQNVISCRWLMRSLHLRDLIHLRSLVSWVLHSRQARKNITELVRLQNELCISFAQKNSNMMSVLAFPTYIDRDYSHKRVFDDVEDALFEKELFKIMKGYDEWLTMIYGNYMTPPPIEKQKPGHSIHKYYWK